MTVIIEIKKIMTYKVDIRWLKSQWQKVEDKKLEIMKSHNVLS